MNLATLHTLVDSVVRQSALFYFEGRDIFLAEIPLNFWVALFLQLFLTLTVVGVFAVSRSSCLHPTAELLRRPPLPSRRNDALFFAGFAVALSAQLLVRENPQFAIPLFISAAMLIAPALRVYSAGLNTTPSVGIKNERVVLWLLCLLALAVRFYRNGEIYPPGIEQDEYIWIEDYLQVITGHHKSAFGTGFYGLPLLQGSITGLLNAVWGISSITVRGWSMVTGALMIFPAYYLVKTLFRPKVALIFVLLLATSPYSVFYGRIISGSRLLFSCLSSMAFLAYAFQVPGRRAYLAAAMSGIFLGFGLNDYFACRVMPVLLLILFTVFVCRQPPGSRLRATTRAGLPALIGFTVTIAPLAWHFYQQPDLLFVRMEEHSALTAFLSLDANLILQQLSPIPKMFLFTASEGRVAWFSSPKVIPFPAPLAACFASAFIALFFVNLRLASALSAALVVSLLPTILSSAPPDSHRALLSILPSHLYVATIIGIAWEIMATANRTDSRALTHRILHSTICAGASAFFNLRQITQLDQWKDEFNSEWKIVIDDIREGLPAENWVAHGSTRVVHSTTLYSTSDQFIGIKLLYPGMRFSPFDERILERGLSEGTSVFYAERPTESFITKLERSYPQAKIKREKIWGIDTLIAIVTVRPRG